MYHWRSVVRLLFVVILKEFAHKFHAYNYGCNYVHYWSICQLISQQHI